VLGVQNQGSSQRTLEETWLPPKRIRTRLPKIFGSSGDTFFSAQEVASRKGIKKRAAIGSFSGCAPKRIRTHACSHA